MAKIYKLYEKRIQARIIKAIEEMEKKHVKTVLAGEGDKEDPLKVMAEYLLHVTHIIIEECNNDEEAIRRLIPKYLPDGIQLDDIKRKDFVDSKDRST
ncbi:MAG TPA: hypothetical protein VN416_07970 [Desulfomonilia bacterium]|nr:hypothetical protein [Desulfomonilia bacterium]